jgi:hypothetical protein
MAEPQNTEFNPLGKLISVLVLLAAALYFTGWIYRWAYFSFFNLEVTTLSLPNESFYFAAFQTFFGDIWAIPRKILFLIVIIFGILIIFIGQKWLGQYLKSCFRRWRVYGTQPNQNFLSNSLTVRNPANFKQKLHTLIRRSLKSKIINFLSSLFNEFIIVFFVLTALFWLATWQAKDDAWNDAVNETSSLPIVTIVMPKDAVLGRKFDNPLESRSIKPNLPKFSIIGDRQSYERLLDKELNDISNPDKPRVWRLLLKGNGYSYIFPALPEKNSKLTFPVVMVYERDNGVQLTILNSSLAKP